MIRFTTTLMSAVLSVACLTAAGVEQTEVAIKSERLTDQGKTVLYEVVGVSKGLTEQVSRELPRSLWGTKPLKVENLPPNERIETVEQLKVALRTRQKVRQ